MSEEERIKELENNLTLVTAEAQGLGSLLLSVQRDCINARKEVVEEIMKDVTRKQFLTLPLNIRRAIMKIQAESIASQYEKETINELF